MERRSQVRFALFALVLVALAFVRATQFSSTGIQLAGDGLDYAEIAQRQRLEGRAPFVYRPVVPLMVGYLSYGNLRLGFSLVCAAAMWMAFWLVFVGARHKATAYVVAIVLFLNYQVLMNAANVGRLDVVVLAVQLAFVNLALRDREALFFLLLPLAATVKESLLVGLLALVPVAFPRNRGTWIRAGASAVGFVAVHVVIRAVAEPTSAVMPYGQGFLVASQLLELLGRNLDPTLPLEYFAAWSGLCFVALYAATTGGASKPDKVLIGVSGFLLIFPLATVNDVHRAWFELFAPLVLYLVLRAATRARQVDSIGMLAFAAVASGLAYAPELLGSDHVHLAIVSDRLGGSSIGWLLGCLVLAALGLAWGKDALGTRRSH